MDEEIDVTQSVFEYLRKMLKVVTLSLFCGIAETNDLDLSRCTVGYRFVPETVSQLTIKVPNQDRVYLVRLPEKQIGITDQLLKEFSAQFGSGEISNSAISRHYALIDDLLTDLQRHQSIWFEHNVGTVVIFNQFDIRDRDQRVRLEAEIEQLLSDCANLADIVYS